MTGKSPLRLGILRPISKNETTGLPLDETILPEYLARAGYQSMMVGKWHLGHYTPNLFPQARGFEHFYGHVTGGIGYWDHNHGGGHDWQRNGETLREEGYSTDLIADEALRILAARDKTRPTFLYVAFNAPHLPNEAPESAIARYVSIEDPKRRVHAGMVSELDRSIGRVLDGFEREGMLENTLVLFSSDNGGIVRRGGPPPLDWFADLLVRVFDRPIPLAPLEFLVTNLQDGASDNSPLPKGKTSIAEGGSRVPAAIWWPGHLEGGQSDQFITISDVLPTLLEAVGQKEMIPGDLDGSSRWTVLNGSPADSPVRDYATAGFDGTAIYRAPWKLHATDPPRLYDVFADPTEENDLTKIHPEVVQELSSALDAWPRGPALGTSFLEIFLDPDAFGGPEDRPPWADVARERASGEL
jgi:arylsulfatase A-like enzyme